MTEYMQDISGASMEMWKYYHQSNDITLTAHEWTAAMGWNTPPDCVAVRIRETDNGGEVAYLTAKDVVALCGKNIVVDGSADARNFDERFWDRLKASLAVAHPTIEKDMPMSNQFQSVILTIAKVVASDKATMDDVRAVEEQGIPLMSLLDECLGGDDSRTVISTGGISATTFVSVIAKYVGSIGMVIPDKAVEWAEDNHEH